MPHDKSGIWAAASPNSPYAGPRAPGDKTRILIVDDHGPYRRGLRAMLDLEPDIEPVGEAGDGREAIEQVERLKPDVVLMDVNMPGMDGMEATRKLSDSHPGLLVIMLTMFKGEEHLREARRAGASAYVLKDAGSEILLQTIRDVMSGETPLLQRSDEHITGPTAGTSPSTPPVVGSPARATDTLITANERTILSLLAAGHANDDIARETGLSESMVRTYLAEIYRKLGIPGRDEAARFARDRGMADRPGSGELGQAQQSDNGKMPES